ncbi:MAG TPA: ABC transporter ATP-binding protein [Acidimicrobiales bacterium]|nr:ABC transporter ATP-binding protein [Acidimicrobiales bacterium]
MLRPARDRHGPSAVPAPGGADVTDSDTDATTGRRGWQLLWRQVRAQRAGLIVGILAGVVWTAAKVTVPMLIQTAIDDGIDAGDTHAVIRWGVIIGLVGVVSAVFTGTRRYWAFREARWAEADLRHRMFAHLQELHFAYHDDARTGQLMSRGNTDLQQIVNFMVMIPLTCANLLTTLAATALMLRMDWRLTILAVGSLPLLNVFAKRFASRLHPAALGVQQESAALAEVVEETVAGVRVVKGFGSEPTQAEHLDDAAERLYGRSIDTARIRGRFIPLLDVLPTIGLVLVMLYGGHLVIDGSLSVGELVAFNAFVVLLIWPLRMLGSIVDQAQRASVSAGRVDEVLATAARIVDPARPEPLADGGGRVEFRDVHFSYPGTGAPVLEGFDLVVEPGESVALVGNTGSGKSTVAKLIPRFYDPTDGAVLIDGVDVRTARLSEVRRAVGIVFEDTFLFSDTIAANIAFADPDAPAEQIERAARLAGAHEFIEELPEGYDTEIGERGFSLSGGQRQRLAIARAILADPRVLILDDATSAVDPTKEHEIRAAMGEVMTARTTIVIAHRPATIAMADRVVLVDDGVVAASGTHTELLASNRRYREVLAAAERETEHVVAADDGALVEDGTR